MKGRNKDLINFRNQKLIARFYWYSFLIGFKFEKCLQYLSIEFDLKEITIEDILTNYAETISELEQKKIDVSFLNSKFPFLNWKINFEKELKAININESLLN